ncbi:MAG: hypothetical protein H7338_23405 [Candidatus Sericytochromatia bacterium]|nr:hypothetical protein [Candidatus Sericytochromatia bacterium]
MRRQRKRQAGIGLPEVLISGTILLFVMLGMNAALISSSLVAMTSKDVTLATNFAQQRLENEKRHCLDGGYFANMPATRADNLMTGLGNDDAYMQRYVRSRLVTPGTAKSVTSATG